MPKKVITILLLLGLVGLGIILCFAINNYIPREAPIPIVKYNNVTIPTVESMYNWLDKENGGKSNLTPPQKKAQRI